MLSHIHRIFHLSGYSKQVILNENQGWQRMGLRLSLLNAMWNVPFFTSPTVIQPKGQILNSLHAGNPARMDRTAPLSHLDISGQDATTPFPDWGRRICPICIFVNVRRWFCAASARWDGRISAGSSADFHSPRINAGRLHLGLFLHFSSAVEFRCQGQTHDIPSLVWMLSLPCCGSSPRARTLFVPGCEQMHLLAPQSQERPVEHSGFPIQSGWTRRASLQALATTLGLAFFFFPLSIKQQLLAKSNRWRKSPLSVLERRISPSPLPLARNNQSHNKHWMLSFRLRVLS